jgi:hypothetical protein
MRHTKYWRSHNFSTTGLVTEAGEDRCRWFKLTRSPPHSPWDRHPATTQPTQGIRAPPGETDGKPCAGGWP